MANALDHLVIAAADLEQGQAYAQALLGVHMPMGGEHPKMATHNLLMALPCAWSDSLAYLEIIAINPAAQATISPRWFNLDNQRFQTRLRQQPQLHTWMLNIEELAKEVARSPYEHGDPMEMSRDDLHWQICVRDDGDLTEQGVVPGLLHWHDNLKPALAIADLGCEVRNITLYHPHAAQLEEWLRSLNIINNDTKDGILVRNSATTYFTTTLQTPRGEVILNSR